MGYSDYLKALLRPLCLYELDEGLGAAELEALGASMDAVCAALSDIERESVLPTAEDVGLSRYEEILPYHPASPGLAQRRAAIMALLRIDDGSFTLPAIRDTIRGCGIRCEVEESKTSQTVSIRFPGVMGEPSRFEAIRARIEQILPCHLAVEYLLQYLTWQTLEGYGLTWRKIESLGLTWTGLECYGEGEDA